MNLVEYYKERLNEGRISNMASNTAEKIVAGAKRIKRAFVGGGRHSPRQTAALYAAAEETGRLRLAGDKNPMQTAHARTMDKFHAAHGYPEASHHLSAASHIRKAMETKR
jgi:hypothetical protein